MPIYEYQAIEPNKGCYKCKKPFEYLQSIHDPPLERCPQCGTTLMKLISRCRACIVETSIETKNVEERAKDYEREGMWSHAAELLDSHAEKTKDPSLKLRAVDNYKKAGYSLETIESHLSSDSFMKEVS